MQGHSSLHISPSAELPNPGAQCIVYRTRFRPGLLYYRKTGKVGAIETKAVYHAWSVPIAGSTAPTELRMLPVYVPKGAKDRVFEPLADDCSIRSVLAACESKYALVLQDIGPQQSMRIRLYFYPFQQDPELLSTEAFPFHELPHAQALRVSTDLQETRFIHVVTAFPPVGPEPAPQRAHSWRAGDDANSMNRSGSSVHVAISRTTNAPRALVPRLFTTGTYSLPEDIPYYQQPIRAFPALLYSDRTRRFKQITHPYILENDRFEDIPIYLPYEYTRRVGWGNRPAPASVTNLDYIDTFLRTGGQQMTNRIVFHRQCEKNAFGHCEWIQIYPTFSQETLNLMQGRPIDGLPARHLLQGPGMQIKANSTRIYRRLSTARQEYAMAREHASRPVVH